MKNIIYALILFFSMSIFSQQETYEFFPAQNPEILVGKTVTTEEISDILKEYGYDNFYKLGKKGDIIPYDPTSKYSKSSKYESIYGKKFRIDNIEKDPKSYNKWWFDLTDLESNELVKFHYNAAYKHQWKFLLLEPMTYPEDWFCKDFHVVDDKFDNKRTVYSDLSSTGINFIKISSGDIHNYYLSIGVNGRTLNVGEKGLSLILDSGEILKYPDVEIKAEASSGSGWNYSAFVELDTQTLEKLKSNYITDARLYIYDMAPAKSYSDEQRQKLVCLTEDKINL